MMPQPDHLTVYLSGRCNLSCDGCYASGISRSLISEPALRRAIGKFAAAAPESPKFTILGGEPLLCRERLYAALRLIRRLFGPAPVHLFTNGMLLKSGEPEKLMGMGVKINISATGVPPSVPVLPVPGLSASIVVYPRRAGELDRDILRLADSGCRSLAWSPDISSDWDGAALRRLMNSSRKLLAEYMKRLRRGTGVWELANGYEAIALADRGEKPGPCRSLALAPDGFFYPCDKMLSGGSRNIRRFRVGADGKGRENFFRLAGRLRPSAYMCPLAPWAAARFGRGERSAPRGQSAARAAAADWLYAAARAGLSSPLFRKIHGLPSGRKKRKKD